MTTELVMRGPGTPPKFLRSALLAAAAAMLFGACGSDEARIDAASQATDPAGTEPTTTEPTSTAAPLVREVLAHGTDPRHLVVRVDCIVVLSDGSTAPVVVDETPGDITLEVVGTTIEPPCNPVDFDVRLEDPVGDRAVLDATTGSEITVGTHSAAAEANKVPAECSGTAAREAVERQVDGGLRSELLACDGRWMAVDTWSDACPATGDTPDPECVANRHTGYWRDDRGSWSIAGFDDCTSVRRQYPDLPDAMCVQENESPSA